MRPASSRRSRGGPDWQATGLSSGVTGIFNLKGYAQAAIWQGASDINSVYPFQITPVLMVPAVEDGTELMCLVYDGDPFDDNLDLTADIRGEWQVDGAFHLNWAGDEYQIPPLG